MRWIFLILTFCFCQLSKAQNSLEKCPNSPNCVRSVLNAKKKIEEPLTLIGNLDNSLNRLDSIATQVFNAEILSKTTNTYQYSIETKIGGFIDDLFFYYDAKNNVIHFKSASRVGYGDFGANKRRIKKLKRKYYSSK